MNLADWWNGIRYYFSTNEIARRQLRKAAGLPAHDLKSHIDLPYVFLFGVRTITAEQNSLFLETFKPYAHTGITDEEIREKLPFPVRIERYKGQQNIPKQLESQLPFEIDFETTLIFMLKIEDN
jgi:hypothetical protein